MLITLLVNGNNFLSQMPARISLEKWRQNTVNMYNITVSAKYLVHDRDSILYWSVKFWCDMFMEFFLNHNVYQFL